MTWTSRLTTLGQARAVRSAAQKGVVRAVAAAAEKTEATTTRKAEDAFRREVYRRDKGFCRCCLQKVERTLADVPSRAEVHHAAGRIGFLRHLTKAALLLCRACHKRVTGQVNDKLVIQGTKFFRRAGQRYIDTRFPVQFKEAA